jgi:hypothetical protein
VGSAHYNYLISIWVCYVCSKKLTFNWVMAHGSIIEDDEKKKLKEGYEKFLGKSII